MNMSCTRALTQPARAATNRLSCLTPFYSGNVHIKPRRLFASSRAAAEGVHDWLEQFQTIQDTAGASYFTRIIQQTDLSRSFNTSSARCIDHTSSSGSQLSQSTYDSSQRPAEPAAAVTMGSHISSCLHAAADAALCPQQVQLPSIFEVPSQTTVPAYQLVGVFRSMLGWPNLPQAARTMSVEAKWGILQLMLMHAEGQQQEFLQQLQQLLDGVLLPDALRKLKKVQANPKIPELNKQSAQQRFHDLYVDCQDTITRWAAATISTPAFRQLQPAMIAVSEAMKVSLASGNWHCPASSANSGKLMEQTALAVLQGSLPPNWSLLPSLHLLGVDGQVFAVQQGCKYEVDMLALDDQGVAVAIVEVKLAAANPLMSLFNDVNSLLRLIEQIKGKTLTAITRSDVSNVPVASSLKNAPTTLPAALPVVAAAASMGETEGYDSDSSSSSSSSSSSNISGRRKNRPAVSLLAKARAATHQAPFAQGPAWQTVHIKAHPKLVPIYVIGKSIGEAEVLKGLSSLVDSAALKLLSTSASTVAQAIMQPVQVEQEQQQQAQQCLSSPGVPLQGADSIDGGRLLRSSSSGGNGYASQGSGISSRITLCLSDDQQQQIRDQVHRRMAVLEQCMIYSICAR